MGDAGEAFLQAVLLEGAHAVVQALREHLGDARVLLDQLLQPVGRNQQLVQAAAPLEAAAAALVAAHGLVERELAAVVAVGLHPLLVHRLHRALRVGLEARRVHELLAVLAQERGELRRFGRIGLLARAQALRQALRQDAEQRVGEVERVHAHVEQPDDRFGRRIRVQRGEHQVAGERGLDAGRRGLLVAHLADHDDVRVGAQECLHHRGEVEPRLAVDLHLAQALLRDLDRILGGPDLGVGRVQELEHRVQRGRLARAGRAADEEQAVGLGDGGLQLFEVGAREAHLLERHRLAGGEDTHDDVLDAAGGRDGGDAQLDVERPELLELDFPVLGFPLLGDVEVAHDLDARRDRRAVARRHLNVGTERAVLAEADLGLRLARIGLDMNVGGPLVVGVDDHLVDELHELVVRSRRGFVARSFQRLARVLAFHAGKEVLDIAEVRHGRFSAVELVQGLPEFLVRRHPVAQARLRKDVRGDARGADALGVEAQHDDAFLRLVDRHPHVALDVFALQVLQQLAGLHPVCLVRLVGHTEELGERVADRRDLHLELIGQHLLDVDRLLPSLARGEVELARREHGVGDQVVVLGLRQLRLLALLEGDGERLRELAHPFLGERAERNARLVVDDLDDADQLVRAALDDRRDELLLGAVSGALVDFLQEAQVGIDRAQLAFVVAVLDVDGLLGKRRVASDRVLGDRQLQVLEGVEAGLHLGDDRLPVLAHRVDGEPVGVEERAHVRAHLEHDLVDVVGGVDLVGDRLQLLLERKACGDVGLRRRRTEDCAHALASLLAL